MTASRDTAGAPLTVAPNPLAAVLLVAGYAVRACLPRKRRLGLLLPALGAVVFGLLAHVVTGETARDAFADMASSGLFGIVLPIGCLVVGDAVLGAEIRTGTLYLTWLSPLSRATIVVGRWLAGTLVAGIVLAVACTVAAIVAGVPGVAAAVGLAAFAGSAAYVAVFVAVGAVARRAVVWSLVIVVLIERLLGAALDGIAQLSPGWLARAAYGGLTHTQKLLRTGVPFGTAAVWRLIVVTGLALAIGAWRLGHLRVAGHGE